MNTEISNGEHIVSRMLTVLNADKEIEVAKYLGVSKQTVYSWKNRGSVPLNYCVAFSLKSGASLDFLILGFDTHLLRNNDDFASVGEVFRLEDLSLEAIQGIRQDPQYTEIPLYDVEASAGNGSFFDQEQISSYLKFRNDWLTREGLHKKDLVAIRVAGDSMDGTLADGDTVLIDRSKKKPDGVFAIRIGDALRIKRLQKMTDGALRVSSDNKLYEPELIHPENFDQIDIVGQCYWRGGRVF